MGKKATLLAALVLAIPAAGFAQEAAEDESGYCKFVRGVAAADSALLYAPELFTSFGAINVGEAEDGTAFGTPKLRLTIGARYDLIELYQGMKVGDRAEAECRRYRAERALEAAVRAGDRVGAGPALAARAAVLADALPMAEKLLASLDGDVRNARATVDELSATQLRVDALRAQAAETEVERGRLESMPHAEARPLVDVIGSFRSSDDRLEELEGTLRRTEAWSFELAGGYDEVFDVDQDVPLFAIATLTFDLGGLWQGAGNERAREGRREWISSDVMGVDRRVSDLLLELRAIREGERKRLAEVTTLLGDLETQLGSIEGLHTERVRRYHSYLWFEVTKLRAERAYLDAHVRELGLILGAMGG